MIRKAILIGSPNVAPKLPGVDVDLRDLQEFLYSSEGGAWEQHEMEVLRDPSKITVLKSLEKAQMADYVFIVCSGHGEHNVGYGLDETAMWLNEKEKIYIREINPKNKRHLVIVDVCRNIVKVPIFESFAMAEQRTLHKSASDRSYARRLFDNAIIASSEGRIVAYSCDKNQSAGDDGEGGIFTQSLLKSPFEISKIRKQRGQYSQTVDINESFELAKAKTYRLNAPQSPVLNAGRRREFFPFGVSQ